MRTAAVADSGKSESESGSGSEVESVEMAQTKEVEAKPQAAGALAAIKPSKEEVEEESASCNDGFFAILFIADVGFVIALMAKWGIKAVSSLDSDPETSISANDIKSMIGIVVGLGVLAVGLSLAMVKLIVTHAHCMIQFVLWVNVPIGLLVALVGLFTNIALTALGIVIALVTAWFANKVRNRVPFAVANLRVAEAAISKHVHLYSVAFLLTAMQVVWAALSAVALLGLASQMPKTTTSGSDTSTTTGSSSATDKKDDNGGIFLLLALAFFWGQEVIKNVGHTTVAGTVATFWYNGKAEGAIGAAFKRATTTSFGSICMGSLIVAIIRLLRSMAEDAKRKGGAGACVAECILGYLQQLMEYLNRWAYVYVGIYGFSFTKAAGSVIGLFRQRGFDALINDHLIGTVLNFAAVGVGIISAAFGGLLGWMVDFESIEDAIVLLAFLGVLIGYGVAITPLATVDSSVATIFVCFAEDPAALKNGHPELYEPLVDGWRNMYPEMMTKSGYCTA